MPIERDQVIQTLNSITDPRSQQGLVRAGLVHGLSLRENRAGFMLEVPAEHVKLYEPIREAAELALLTVPGVEKAQVVLTAGAAAPPKPDLPTPQVRRATLTPDPKRRPARRRRPRRPQHCPRYRHRQRQGRVGKSTVAVTLALALARAGKSVGLLDADIYGPSIPTMLGVSEKPVYADGKLQPLAAHGLKLMSIGFLVEAGGANVWRGPMASRALQQMIHDVNWASEAQPMDLLIVDLLPARVIFS